MLVSILIPVYNERTVVEASLGAVLNAPLPENLERELVVVDDCSTDGTSDILKRLAQEEPRIRLFRHEVNQGKGAAVRTAVGHAAGDFCLIQDADLEYDPKEYPILLRPLLEGHADAVFGSRYLVREQTRVLPYWHTMINKFLTVSCNMFANLNVTDMETCYKVFRTDLLKSIPIRSNRFGIEPEITMKCAKRKLRIYEVPISYHGRTYEEGKKIGWRDGVKALAVILKFWVVDDLYAEPYGKGVLLHLTRTPNYMRRIVGLIRPALGDTVVEIGAGLGALSGLLMGKRRRYFAVERDAMYFHALQNRFLRTPNVDAADLDYTRAEAFAGMENTFDSAVAMNVIETLERPEAALGGLASALKPGGRLVLVTAQHPGLHGASDRALGGLRRYSREQLSTLLEGAGFAVERVVEVNKAAVPVWWFSSRALGRESMGKLTLKLFDKLQWLWRLCDALLPWRGLSMVTYARKKA